MKDTHKSKSQLIEELHEIRRRVAEMEKIEAQLKQTTDSLRDSGNRLRSLLDQTTEPLFCFECDPPIPTHLPVEEQIKQIYNCILVECNDICARAFGSTQKEQVIGKKLYAAINTQTVGLDNLFRAIVTSGYRIIDGESTEMLKDGGYRYYLINAYGIIEGDLLLRIWGTFRDVTKQKEIEQKLITLSSAVEQTSNSIAIIDLDGIVQYANPSFLQLNEYTPEQIIGKNWRTFLSTNSQLREKYPEIREKILIKGSVWEGEITNQLPSGKVAWREGRFFPIKNARGEITYVVFSSTDITLRKQAEIALRESEEQYRFLLNNTSDFIIRLDRNGFVVFGTDASRQFSGYELDEILNTSGFERIHPDDRDKTRDELKRVIETGTEGRVEYRLKRKSGEYMWVEATGRCVFNAAGEAEAVVVQRDVTDRKQSELALRDSEKRYRILLENIPSVAWISDREGRTIFISDNVEKIYGFSSSEITAAGEALWFGRIHPEDTKRVQDAYQMLFLHKKDFNIEYRIQRKDGEWIWLLDRANLVEKIAEEPYAYGVFSDISDYKHTEEALQLYTNRLTILYQINQGILIAQSPTEISKVALRWIRQLIPCYRAAITLFEPGSNMLKVFALETDGLSTGGVGTQIEYDRIQNIESIDEGLRRGQIVMQGRHLTGALSELMRVGGINTLAIVPLIHEGELIGTLNISWLEPYTLTNLQEDIAHEVAAQLSIAIRQTQLRETEQRRRKELELLEHISTAMRYADKSEQLFVILANEFKALFNTDASAILIPHDGRMECAFVSGPEEQKERLLGTKEVIEKFSQILFAGKSHFISEQEFDLPGIFSTALLPFLSQQNILGGAVLFWCGRHEFSNEECHLLQTVAGVAGIALHRMIVLETLEQQVANRTRDLSALYDVTAVSSQSLNLQEILDQSLRKVLEVMSSGIGVIHLLDEDGETMRLAASQGIPADVVQKINLLAGDDMRIYDVFSHKGVVIIPDLSSDPRVSKLIGEEIHLPYLAVPIYAKDRTLGVLGVVGEVGSTFSVEAASLLTSITGQIGIAIMNARLYEQAQQVAILTERQRLARDLHDSVTQSLYSLNLMAATGQKLLESGSNGKQISHIFSRLGTTAHQALKEMRLLVYQLRPFALEKEGLAGALRQRLEAVEGRVEIKTKLLVDDLPKLSPAIEEGLYHIAQEALNNALKHAETTNVDVTFHLKDDWLNMEIRDYGKGFVVVEPNGSHGMGLNSMRERAKIIGGELQITSESGKGTCVGVRVKVTQAEKQ